MCLQDQSLRIAKRGINLNKAEKNIEINPLLKPVITSLRVGIDDIGNSRPYPRSLQFTLPYIVNLCSILCGWTIERAYRIPLTRVIF